MVILSDIFAGRTFRRGAWWSSSIVSTRNSVARGKLLEFFFIFPAEKAAGNPLSGGNFRTKIFRRNFSAGNPFLSDLWHGHDEIFNVHIKPNLIGEPCILNCWLLPVPLLLVPRSVNTDYWIVSQTDSGHRWQWYLIKLLIKLLLNYCIILVY